MATFLKRCLTDWPLSRRFVTAFMFVGLTWVGVVPMWMLAVDGIETKATITGVDPRRTYRGIYEFEVDGRLFRGRQGFEDVGKAEVRVGHQMPVTYSAKNPSFSLLGPKSKYGWTNAIGLTFGVLVFVAAISVISLLVDRRSRHGAQ